MQLEFTQLIHLPRDIVFRFHENPAHLPLLHQGWSAFRMLQHDGSITPGQRTWFEITVGGIMPVVLGFEHTLYEPPRSFAEQLIHGPFRRFVHVHEFEEAEAGTRVRDILEVELPWCYGGEFVMRNLLAPSIREAFRLRARALLNLVEAGEWEIPGSLSRS
jgi:ligand-binding SRPBCC domain-containing protein